MARAIVFLMIDRDFALRHERERPDRGRLSCYLEIGSNLGTVRAKVRSCGADNSLALFFAPGCAPIHVLFFDFWA
jgi:hypothetical protein